MKKVSCAVSFLLLGLTACLDSANQTPANQIAFNDFEAVEGWSGDAVVPSLTKERAHSGVYSVRVADGTDYSLGYRTTLGKISNTRLRKIKVQAWAYVPNPQADCVLVTEVRNSNNDKSNLWNGLNLTQAVKASNKWVLVEKEIELPATATAKSQLQVYLWRNTSPQPTYIDDLRILRIE